MLRQWLVQQAFGGLRRIPDAAARITQGGGGGESGRTRLGVTRDSLSALLTGKAPVLVFRGAVPLDICRPASERLEALAREPASASCSSPAAGAAAATRFAVWYLGGDRSTPPSDYLKLGYTKTDVFREEGFRMAAGRAASTNYLEQAATTRRLLDDEVFADLRNPLQDIEEELNGLPGVACRLECCPRSGRAFLPCVVRRMAPGARKADGNIHMDTVLPGRTFSINTYLTAPEGPDSGGEVVLYPMKKDWLSRRLNAHFFSTLEVQNFYPGRKFYTDEVLQAGDPIVYKPSAGDVVIIDPAYPHAVRDFRAPSGGAFHRVSLQTFVQASWRGPCWRARQLHLEYAV